MQAWVLMCHVKFPILKYEVSLGVMSYIYGLGVHRYA
jgi:hypothetical protein